jgi:hypothetical protein
MAKPLVFKPVTVDFKADLQRRLEKAPEEHAAALLAAYNVLEAAYDEGLLDILHGMGPGHDYLTPAATSQPEGVAGIRNPLTAAKILPNLILRPSVGLKAMTSQWEHKREQTPQPVAASAVYSEDSRRAIVHDAGVGAGPVAEG